jgi:hypothetical protein
MGARFFFIQFIVSFLHRCKSRATKEKFRSGQTRPPDPLWTWARKPRLRLAQTPGMMFSGSRRRVREWLPATRAPDNVSGIFRGDG